eukprot:6950470-Heterocapsa_arctica.AAC.1
MEHKLLALTTEHAGSTGRNRCDHGRDSHANPSAGQEHAMGLRTRGGKSFTISLRYAGQRVRHA